MNMRCLIPIVEGRQFVWKASEQYFVMVKDKLALVLLEEKLPRIMDLEKTEALMRS